MEDFMKSILFALPLFVFGCSSSPPPKPENTECIQVAKYARTVATLRDMNVSESDIDSFSQVPVALTFPYRKVRSEVYATKTETPADAFTKFYHRCDEAGYSTLLQALQEDERRRIAAEKKKSSGGRSNTSTTNY
jgi:hypothetical protein